MLRHGHLSWFEVVLRGRRRRSSSGGATGESDKRGGIPVDALIAAAARALAAGDPLGALQRIALKDDARALALRGIAMAQLGDFARAKVLLRRAARAFGAGEAVERARCVVAEAEVALAARDFGGSAEALDAARATLEEHGDRGNAAHAKFLAIRRSLLIGRIAEAERALVGLDPAPLPPATRTVHALVVAGIAIRRLRTRDARAALARARRAARQAGIPSLMNEVEEAALLLRVPAARSIANGRESRLLLEEVEALLNSNALVVDGCRRAVRRARRVVSLATRPVLFTLARALGEAWPGDVPRDALVARVFASRFVDASHRARLRVEIGRLRRLLRELADVRATPRGFALAPLRSREVVVLAPPVEGEDARVLAMLGDGQAWSSSALALAIAASQRTVQRALDSLESAGKIRSFGRARARRWTSAPLPGITTTLLLPAPVASN
jgi:hypothetical protein